MLHFKATTSRILDCGKSCVVVKALKTSDYKTVGNGPTHAVTMDLLKTSFRFFYASGH